MPVIHAPESAFAQEMRKWEGQYTQYGPPGRPYNPNIKYPTRMYKATRQADGTRTLEGMTAADEHERRNLESRGFVYGGQQAAIDALDQEQTEHGKLAAEINFEARRMSDGARAEVEAAQEAAGARHLPAIPTTPTKRRGRPAKVKADLVTESK